MKKFEIEKTKPTFIISVLKVDIIKVGLVFSISHFFITKTPLANNWRRKKIPSCSYSALVGYFHDTSILVYVMNLRMKVTFLFFYNHDGQLAKKKIPS